MFLPFQPSVSGNAKVHFQFIWANLGFVCVDPCGNLSMSRGSQVSSEDSFSGVTARFDLTSVRRHFIRWRVKFLLIPSCHAASKIFNKWRAEPQSRWKRRSLQIVFVWSAAECERSAGRPVLIDRSSPDRKRRGDGAPNPGRQGLPAACFFKRTPLSRHVAGATTCCFRFVTSGHLISSFFNGTGAVRPTS